MTFVEKKSNIRIIPYIHLRAPRQYTALPEGSGRANPEIQSLDTTVTNIRNHKTISSSWGLHLIVVRRFEYADNHPKSYTSGSVATGRASHAGKVEG